MTQTTVAQSSTKNTTGGDVLTGQHALVTGGSEGIGRGIAERLLDAGATVSIAARRREVLDTAVDALRERCGDDSRVAGIVADIGDTDSVSSMFARAEADSGPLNIMVANAGGGSPVPFLELTPEQWSSCIDLNLTGTFFCVQAAARSMVRHEGANRSIIVVSSIRALGARPSLVPYGTAKAGLNQLVRLAAYELAATGVRVNALSPGVTATPLTLERNSLFDERAATVPMGRAGTPADMASAALYLASPDSSFVTGTNLVVDGGESLY
ncbi:SDR family NAD(P)-dependent oxidoreductase [Rhodococcus chondri]|uniref:SDR family NAD(P)-dependent oxidoreductase n=1 Tax=Rhodococcus chondri TaxID=3065941 RepID=A0ABU7JT31_9NOCA|nr:SDR family NAD(P)-dependent oxidoreductase [Rhodococcus sp. CC-R104]MEE2033188.1 SDR family NAD(P)-dependent oxidoreductase [Rhodococcus sp. CC-R104]